ncbi:hypothetical protein PIB30_094677 [Stylosanthes scabra]|uniref:Uncharacterized protein n=1 Tax=Stylosanthes scabra TaxID=79078 RepID=A0ABU6RW23_9FABA|nr:hypothetical protein [Stylosanthes scabra]
MIQTQFSAKCTIGEFFLVTRDLLEFLYNDNLFSKLRNSDPVARAAAGRSSNGAVAGELKTCAPVHVLIYDVPSFDLNRRYFSCEDSLSAYQIDDVDFHHRARFEATFEGLVQERAKIMEAQKRIEVQPLAVAELASSVMRQFAHATSPCQEERLSAITLRSGTQLKVPTSESSNPDTITIEGRNMRGDVEHEETPPTVEQETISCRNKIVVDPNLNSLPFPAVAKKTRKAKPPDLHIIELLKKVEVTLPLFALIQQMPMYAKFP